MLLRSANGVDQTTNQSEGKCARARGSRVRWLSVGKESIVRTDLCVPGVSNRAAIRVFCTFHSFSVARGYASEIWANQRSTLRRPRERWLVLRGWVRRGSTGRSVINLAKLFGSLGGSLSLEIARRSRHGAVRAADSNAGCSVGGNVDDGRVIDGVATVNSRVRDGPPSVVDGSESRVSRVDLTRNLEAIEENGGPRGGAGQRQLPDGHRDEQVHTGCQG